MGATLDLELQLNGRLPGLNREAVLSLVRTTAALARRHRPFRMSVNTVTDAAIRRLNRTYRGRDRVTDVLSFRLADGAAQPGGGHDGAEDLGDLFVCLPQVRRQAKAVPRSPRIETALMIAHGTLHLLGYDHVTLAQETRMFALQHEALAREGFI